jgi:hypothetical protein
MADPTGGGILSSIFNMQNAITLTLDVLLFAWMHFTPEGMAFGAGIAETLGLIEPLAEMPGISEVVASTGELAYAV